MISKSPRQFQRLKVVRRFKPTQEPLDTAGPRYETKTTLSQRRTQKRMGKWLKNA